jgi:uncharacterized membrane protein
MNRAKFCAALRKGLSDMPQAAVEDIVGDYDAHFAEGAAAGRSEEEIAAALGDPKRLARELRAERGLQRWEQKRTPANAVAAVFALIGLGAIDIIFLIPLLMTVAGVLLGLFFASIGVFVGGAAMLAFGPLAGAPGGPFVPILFGLGMIASAICAAAILILITVAIVNATVWFARLHYRALKLADS